MKVSIIIPVYNVELYVEECLQSVANQTMTEGIECIIVDDRGQDNSMDIVRHFVDDYQGAISFHILKHEKNSGLSLPPATLASKRQQENLFISSTAMIL